ncbi:MAG TPA: hypothetical protein VF933_00210 [Streptosporangiaceae bacterium]
MHVFSGTCLRELPGGWRELRLRQVQVPHREAGEPLRHVWRGIARR